MEKIEKSVGAGEREGGWGGEEVRQRKSDKCMVLKGVYKTKLRCQSLCLLLFSFKSRFASGFEWSVQQRARTWRGEA